MESWKNLVYSPDYPYNARRKGEVLLDNFMDIGSVIFWLEMTKFPELEELLIVVPPTDYLMKAVENKDFNYENFEYVIYSSPVECDERVRDFRGI